MNHVIEQGEGAWKNGKRIFFALLWTFLGTEKLISNTPEIFAKLLPGVQWSSDDMLLVMVLGICGWVGLMALLAAAQPVRVEWLIYPLMVIIVGFFFSEFIFMREQTEPFRWLNDLLFGGMFLLGAVLSILYPYRKRKAQQVGQKLLTQF